MVQIIPNNERPSFMEQLLTGLNEAVPGIQQFLSEREQRFANEQKQSKMMQALKESGLNPMDVFLPEHAQKAKFGSHFSKEKPMTALQQAQQRLAEERLNALKENQGLFNQLFFGQQSPEEQISGEGQEQFPGMGIQQPEQKPFSIKDIPEDKLRMLSNFAGQPGEKGVLGSLAKNELDRQEKERKLKREEFVSERAFHSSYSKKAEEEAENLRTSLPKKEMALSFARNAIETGDLNYFSLDKLADATGIDLFRTAKGSQLITAGKENLLSNMGRVSARAQNIWFEQRLNSMFPKIGQSKEANLTVSEMLEAENVIDKEYLNAFDNLAKEDEEKYGFVKKDISKRAHDQIKPLEKEIFKRTTYKMKEIEEQEKGISTLKKEVGKNVAKGTPLTLSMAKLYKEKYGDNALRVAEKNGYYIPTLEEFKIFQQSPQENKQ